MGIEDLSEAELRTKVLEANLHKAPSVGAIVNQILAINPDLLASDVMQIVRSATSRRGESAGDFASAEVIDIPRALELARSTLSC
jgi:Zn-dependent protease with chaperone function